MKWEGRRESENVEDVRGQRVAGGAPGIGLLISLVLRMFGLKGAIVLAVLGLIAWGTGLISPSALIGGRQVPLEWGRLFSSETTSGFEQFKSRIGPPRRAVS